MKNKDIEIGRDLVLQALTEIEWDKPRSHYHHNGRSSPYWMEKMLQVKALLIQAEEILGGIE